ncbi:zinc ribbon domain-containing protein, partial [Roseomonas sp. KE2513]|uniref:zinc ribbon domain-containing protein n=1 Tax=Roseomonas sp. KE2513 TaxID=2479202 RepID=UPI001E3A003D
MLDAFKRRPAACGLARNGFSSPPFGHCQPGELRPCPDQARPEPAICPPQQYCPSLLAARAGQLRPCGLSCLGRSLSARHRYYCCRGKLSPLNSYCETPCPSRFIPAEQVEALVWEDLRQLLTHPEAIRHALERAHGGHWLPQELRARRETLRRGQASVAQQIERLTEVYLAGVVGLEEYRRRRGDLEQRQQALAAQEQQLAAQTKRQADIARLGL